MPQIGREAKSAAMGGGGAEDAGAARDTTRAEEHAFEGLYGGCLEELGWARGWGVKPGDGPRGRGGRGGPR